MNIQYANAHVFAIPAPVSYLKGTLHPLAGGKYSVSIPVKQPDGSFTDKFLSVQPDGSYQVRDKVGDWESFSIDSGAPLLRVTAYQDGVNISYAIAFRAA